MLEEQNSEFKRKYAWISRWAKLIEERARIDGKANNTYIVYKKIGEIVKETPNGTVISFKKDGEA